MLITATSRIEVRAIRKKFRLTRREVSQLVGLSQDVITACETAYRPVSDKKLARYLAFMHALDEGQFNLPPELAKKSAVIKVQKETQETRPRKIANYKQVAQVRILRQSLITLKQAAELIGVDHRTLTKKENLEIDMYVDEYKKLISFFRTRLERLNQVANTNYKNDSKED